MSLDELILDYHGVTYEYKLPECLHAIKDTDPERRRLWCRKAREALGSGNGPAVIDRAELDLPALLPAGCGEVDGTLSIQREELLELERQLTELDRQCEGKYRTLCATVFQGITADMAARRMMQAEHELKELKNLSNRRRMDISWILPLICAALVTILAAAWNPRLYVVTAMLLVIAALSYLVVLKTFIPPEKASQDAANILGAFGAADLDGMRANVQEYSRQYNDYLRDWHASYALSQQISKLRQRVARQIDQAVSDADSSAPGQAGRFLALFNQAVQAGSPLIILNDVFFLFNDSSCQSVLQTIAPAAGQNRQIVILSGSGREVDFLEKGWVVPPPGFVPNTPFRLLG